MKLATRMPDDQTDLVPVALPALLPLPVKPALLQCGSVDMLNGAHVYSCDDLAVDGVMPLVFTTRYWGAWPAHGEHPLVAASPMGHRWTHSYMTCIVQMEGASLVLWDDHSVESFTAASGWQVSGWQVSGWQIPRAARPGSRLHRDPDGCFKLTHADSTAYFFNSDGQLACCTDRHGNTVQLAYDSQRRLASIADTGSNRGLTLAYRDGGLHRVTDPLGRSVTYVRNGNGDLAAATDPCGHTRTFHYVGASLLASANDGRGNTVFENIYDNGVIVFQRDARALQARAADDPANGSYGTAFSYSTVAIRDRAARLTTGTDRAGNAYSAVTDITDGDCLSRTLALSPGQLYAEHSAYAARSLPASRTTYSGPLAGYTPGAGNTVTYTYDDNGNCRSEVTAMSRSRIHAVSRTYDPAGNMLTRSVYEGPEAAWRLTPKPGKADTWHYTYNKDNTLRAVLDPLGGIRTLAYLPGGLPHTVTDELGNVTTTAYAAGSVVGVTNALGEATVIANDAIGRPVTVLQTAPGLTPARADFTYDGNGRELTRITRSASAAGIETVPETVMTTYDGNGNVTTIEDAGNTTVYTYNANNRAYAVARCSSYGVERVIELDYDRLDFPLSATLHCGLPQTGSAASAASSIATSWYTYDAMGLMTREVRADGSIRCYRDQMLPMPQGPFSRRSCTTAPDENAAHDSPAKAEVRYAAIVYDPLGRPISVTGRDGRTATIVHTTRPDRATGSVLHVATATFPADTAQKGRSRILIRDAIGRTVSVTDQAGLTTTFSYAAGKEAGPNGSHALAVTIEGPETGSGRTVQSIYFDACGRPVGGSGACAPLNLKEIAGGLQLCPDSGMEAMNTGLFDWLATA